MIARVIIGSDHRGFELKQYLISFFALEDIGCFTPDPCDYPDIVDVMSEKIESLGILICNTGIGMTIAANKKHNLRAALCFNEDMAKTAREHNDANILCLGAKYLCTDVARACVDIFLKTQFDGSDRNIRRIAKIR